MWPLLLVCVLGMSNTWILASSQQTNAPSTTMDLCPIISWNEFGDDTLQALCCSELACASLHSECALCPNSDIAGIGVRLAFYIQSFLNASLIVFSPADSAATTWACTLLTAALVIAGLVSKARGNLTLHHASLVLNFATLSTITSLAVAPMLPVWRLTAAEYCEEQERQHGIFQRNNSSEDEFVNTVHRTLAGNPKNKENKKRAKSAQKRARLVISVALLLQVALQWTWGIFLFVSPVYSQPERSGSTLLYLFMHQFTTSSINTGTFFIVWAAWLLFSLGVTLFLAAYLAAVGSDRSQKNDSSIATALSSRTPVLRQWGSFVLNWMPRTVRDTKFSTVAINMAAIGLWVMYVVASELQIKRNNLFSGEDETGVFGQLVALIASGTPLWSLIYALYKYPARRRRLLGFSSRPGVPDKHTRVNEDIPLLPALDSDHVRDLSSTTWTSEYNESIEMLRLPKTIIVEPLIWPFSASKSSSHSLQSRMPPTA